MELLNTEDYLIVCGDFGFLFYGNVTEQLNLTTLNQMPGTLLFVDGNHENFPLINSYPVKEWNGGKVHVIDSSIFHLIRGQIFNINGNSIFTMGGGVSIDKAYRIPGFTWWSEEMPSDEELQTGLNKLKEVDWKVDYIFTHTAPNTIQDIVIKDVVFKPYNKLSAYLEDVKNKLQYSHWYFGHYHKNETILNNHTVLYKEILPIGGMFND